MRLRFRRRMEPVASVNLVPMIDVVFQLVVFLMVTTTFKIEPALALTLPSSTSSQPVALTPLVVSVAGEDQLFINDVPTTLQDLATALAAFDNAESEQVRSIIIDGDRTIPYALLVQVLDQVRQSGYSSVALRTRAAPGGN